MTFKDQLKEAKRKELENRLIRDITFIVLGVIFLIISILCAYNKDKENNKRTSIIYENSFISNRI